jgi:hypothetical protein
MHQRFGGGIAGGGGESLFAARGIASRRESVHPQQSLSTGRHTRRFQQALDGKRLGSARLRRVIVQWSWPD